MQQIHLFIPHLFWVCFERVGVISRWHTTCGHIEVLSPSTQKTYHCIIWNIATWKKNITWKTHLEPLATADALSLFLCGVCLGLYFRLGVWPQQTVHRVMWNLWNDECSYKTLTLLLRQWAAVGWAAAKFSKEEWSHLKNYNVKVSCKIQVVVTTS